MPERKDYTGLMIDDYEVIGMEDINGGWFAIAKCTKCGHIKKRKIAELKRVKNIHSFKSCGIDFIKHEGLTGDFEYIGPTNQHNSHGETLHEIRCKKCGTVLLHSPDSLQRCVYLHNGKNCGDSFYIDRIGMQFDDMIITDYIGKTDTKAPMPIYSCKCLICGRTKNFEYYNLVEHKGTTHHACSAQLWSNEIKYLDIFKSKWSDMRNRTTNPKCDRYNAYGERGISSDYYKNFIDFYDDQYESFIKHVEEYGISNTTLERIDVNKNYDKENIKWATWEEQFNNKQNTVYFYTIDSLGNKVLNYGVGKYEKEHNLSHNFIFNRLYGIVKTKEWNGLTFELIGNTLPQEDSLCKT